MGRACSSSPPEPRPGSCRLLQLSQPCWGTGGAAGSVQEPLGGRIHREQSRVGPAPQAGAADGHSFPCPLSEQRLSKEEGRAFPAGKEAIPECLSPGLTRALSPACCHIYLSRTGAVPWLAAALAAVGALHPGHGARSAPRFSPTRLCFWLGQDSSVVLVHDTNTRFPSAFLGFFLAVPSSFTREQQWVKKVVAVVSVSFSPLISTLFAQDTQ